MGKAARLFNGTAEQTLYGRVTPTAEQREFLQTQWNQLAEHLKATLAVHGYPISTWLQGSYKYGTLIKPIRKDEAYDVDVGVYFEWDPASTRLSPTATQLRAWVQEELKAYAACADGVREIVEPPKERCSRAIYERQFHIDTPTYHFNPETQARRLARLSGGWEHSDPKQLYTWFRDVVGEDNRDQLRRLIRYLKGWAAVAFDDAPDSRPSSIFLTVTAAEAFSEMWGARFFGIADDDALIALVQALHMRLSEEKRVANPRDSEEDLNRIPADAWDGFLSRLNALNDAAQAASEAEDEAAAALAWEEAFGFLMPLPEADEVEVVEPTTDRAVMQVPEIEISVFERKGGQCLATYRNEVPRVPRHRWLLFRIANAHVIPQYADVSWTVRNDGEHAELRGDLGHVQRGIAKFTAEESTAYVGKHYMDCVVRVGGRVFAVRRVPVHITPDPQKLVAQAQRPWNRLRTRRGRRQ